jgi:prolyl oligopeptidase
MDLDHPQPEHWQDLLPEAPTPLQSVSYLKDRLIATYLKDAHNEVRLFDLEGRALGVLDAPALSSISGFYGQSTDDETYYSVSSYTSPGAIYRYQVTENRSSLFWKPDFPVDLSAYQTELHFADSPDGTRVPIFLIRNPNSSSQPQPTILYGYGGFNISLTPSFSPAITIWLEQGGAYAVACLRGGGEYGERWHEGGQKENKQNVFDDCIACAEYLISKNITSPGQLAIKGGSNGGLLVGAVINHRPELFAAAAPAVGVMDMLRFHKFTIGWAWKNEYGDPDSAEDFPNLLRYSPYHNLSAEKDYPATLIQTADHDDRVFPAHSFKYGAALQHAKNRGSKPMLMRIDTKAGHGAGKPTDKIIQSQADEFAFFLHAMQPAPGLK